MVSSIIQTNLFILGNDTSHTRSKDFFGCIVNLEKNALHSKACLSLLDQLLEIKRLSPTAILAFHISMTIEATTFQHYQNLCNIS